MRRIRAKQRYPAGGHVEGPAQAAVAVEAGPTRRQESVSKPAAIAIRACSIRSGRARHISEATVRVELTSRTARRFALLLSLSPLRVQVRTAPGTRELKKVHVFELQKTVRRARQLRERRAAETRGRHVRTTRRRAASSGDAADAELSGRRAQARAPHRGAQALRARGAPRLPLALRTLVRAHTGSDFDARVRGRLGRGRRAREAAARAPPRRCAARRARRQGDRAAARAPRPGGGEPRRRA